jgi:single-strand DNA-binding protein
MGVNKVILIGNVGQAPSTRYTSSGNPVSHCSLATSNYTGRDEQGQKKESTEWHNLVFFGHLAQLVEQFVGKGTMLYVDGKLKTNKWERDGQKFSKVEVMVDSLEFINSSPTKNPPASAPTPTTASWAEGSSVDDEYHSSVDERFPSLDEPPF